MKYAWIAKHKAVWPVTLTCEVLEVSASGYFEHWKRKDADKPSKPGANNRLGDEVVGVNNPDRPAKVIVANQRGAAGAHQGHPR